MWPNGLLQIILLLNLAELSLVEMSVVDMSGRLTEKAKSCQTNCKQVAFGGHSMD